MATYNVSSASALQNALSSASAGDTINLAAGNYGNLALNNVDYGSGITITSANSSNPATFTGVTSNNAHGITFDNVVLDYNYSSGDNSSIRPFSFENSSDIAILNSEIDGDTDPSTGVGTGLGLFVRNVDGFTLQNTEIHNFYRGATIYNSDDVNVTSNEVHAIRSDGIDFVEVRGVTIEGNHFHDFEAQTNTSDHRDMIQFWTYGTTTPSTDITIRANIFDIGDGSWTQSIFMGNEVANGNSNTHMYYQNVLIEDNVIYNYHLHGITLGETNGLTIRDNTVLQAIGNPNAEGNSEISGSVTIPRINVDSSSTNVTVQNNVSDQVSGYNGQSSWTVSGNVDVDPSEYDNYFTSTSIAAGAPHSYVAIGGTAIDGVGSPLISNTDAGLVLYGSSSADILNGYSGEDKLFGGSGSDQLYSRGGDDHVYAGNGNDVVYLSSGNDYVQAGGGQESFYGGSGSDYISYYNSTGGIVANLATNTISGSWASNDTISSFESITGSGTGADNITGTSGANTIVTSGGNDYVYAGNGNDEVSLGSGNDYVKVGGGQETFYGGSGLDYISYYDSTGGITANLATNTISGSWASNDTISSFESITGSGTGADNITGTSGANTIVTSGGNDYVYAGNGNDEVSLGSGNDYVKVGGGQETFYGGSGLDYISYYDSTGGITANLATNTISGSWASNDTISSFESITGSGTGADNITGTSGANTIVTSGGNDYVYAGNGNDFVDLGSGNDFVGAGGGQETFYGGSGNDYISYYGSGGITANLATNTISGSWASNDTISSFESITGSGTGADNITGTSGANTIRTYGGNDYVYAGNGADYVSLGEGDDYVSVGGGQETFYGGAGNDYISYYNSTGGVTIDLQANTASGSWAVNDIVNGFESVTGSAVGADTILGTSGANTIRTSGGNDELDGRAGNDILYGGSGSDTFHFDLGGDADVIMDFQNNVDTIEFENFNFGSQDPFDYASQVGSDVVFNFGGGDILTVENVTIDQLQNDVIF